MIAQAERQRDDPATDGAVLAPVPFDRRGDRVGAGADFAHIPVGMLTIDSVYQRGLNANRVAQIVREFDADVFQAITVSKRRDGSFWVLDGQHRVEAVRLMCGEDPATKVPALILRNLDQAAEARIFYKLNRHRLQPTTGDAFKARLVFGEPVAVAIKATLDRHGVALRFWGTELAANECAAMAALETLSRSGRLDRVLDLIGRAWPSEVGAYKGRYLLGIDRFLGDWGRYFALSDDSQLAAHRMDRLIDVLATMGPRGLEKGADFYVETIHARVATACSRAIYQQYQKSLRGRLRLPDWGPRAGDPDAQPAEGEG
jgi:hypothetical protein